MTEITLSPEEKEFVDETVEKLTTKQTTLLALAESMKLVQGRPSSSLSGTL